MKNQLRQCQECGMYVRSDQYHPYGACLMFKACGDGSVVKANLLDIRMNGRKQGLTEAYRRINALALDDNTIKTCLCILDELNQPDNPVCDDE